MTKILPQSIDKLNNPSHSMMHRVVSVDTFSPESSINIDSSGNVTVAMSVIETTPTLLKLNQTIPQTITGGIPLLTNLTPTTDYEIATKKYVDDQLSGENFWDRTGTTLSTHTADDSVTLTKNDIKATVVNSLSLANNTVSDAVNTIQNSPTLKFLANRWVTDGTPASQTSEWKLYALGISGVAAGSSSQFEFKHSKGGAAETTPFYLTVSGNGGFAGGVSATNGTFSGLITNNQSLTTTSTDGLVLNETTASDATPNTTRYSPRIRFTSHVWDTTAVADKSMHWKIENVPITGATPASTLNFASATDAGAYVNTIQFTTDGNIFAYSGMYAPGGFFCNRTGMETTSVVMNTLTATDAATVGVPVRYSPAMRFRGTAWNTTATAASNTISFKQEVRPTSGATTGGSLWWGYDNNGGGYTDIMNLSSAGVLQVTSFLSYRQVGTTSLVGLELYESTAASAGATVRHSPAIVFTGRAWNTTDSASNTINWKNEVRPVSGTTTSGSLYWSFDNNGGGYGDVMSIGYNATLTCYGQIAITGALAGNGGLTAVGSLSMSRAGITTTSYIGLNLVNSSASLIGTPLRYSPAIVQSARAWDINDAVDTTINFKSEVIPVSASVTSGRLSYSFDNSGGGYTERMALYSDGRLIVGAGSTYAGASLIEATSDSASTYSAGMAASTTIRNGVTNRSTTNNNVAEYCMGTLTADGTYGSGIRMFGIFTSHADAAISAEFQLVTRNAGTFVEALRASKEGKIGIGTTSPLTKLHIAGATQASGGAFDSYGNLFISSTEYTGSDINKGGSLDLGGCVSSTTPYTFARLHGKKENNTNGNLAGYMAFEVSNNSIIAEVMRLTSGGHLGVNTANPYGWLDIASGKDFAIYAGADVNATTRTANTEKFVRIVAPSYATSSTVAGTPVALITAYLQASANIFSFGGGSGSAYAATVLDFYTAANATTSTGSKRMSIDSAGNVGIGISAPTEKLDVVGNVAMTGTIKQNSVTKTISGSKVLTDGSATGMFEVAVGTGELVGGDVSYTIYVVDGTDFQSHQGGFGFVAVNKAGTVTSDCKETYLPATAIYIATSGTLTDAVTCTDGAGKVTLNMNANTSLAGATITIKYTVTLHSMNVITLL